MEPMKPMEPMEPMRPMQPFAAPERWWPEHLGRPASSGSQNGTRYAFFPQVRRLLIERDGRRVSYDSADHCINGIAQAQGSEQSLIFTSQHGPVPLAELQQVD